ncbi:MAG TPA: hypothetical protein VMV38_01550 [Candidatus Paceibacterota bacterium]|nr:hypothetical protein [Candidatus Paceibacterota bacterium]
MRDTIIYAVVGVVAIGVGILFFFFGKGTFLSPASPVAHDTADTAVTVVVPFTPLIQGLHSGIATRTNYLITSSTELSELWKTINAPGTPPTVNFATDQVLAVFAGGEASSTIQVAKVEDTSVRVVSIAIQALSGTCVSKKTIASPYELVMVPATSLPLTHKDLVATTSCLN